MGRAWETMRRSLDYSIAFADLLQYGCDAIGDLRVSLLFISPSEYTRGDGSPDSFTQPIIRSAGKARAQYETDTASGGCTRAAETAYNADKAFECFAKTSYGGSSGNEMLLRVTWGR